MPSDDNIPKTAIPDSWLYQEQLDRDKIIRESQYSYLKAIAKSFPKHLSEQFDLSEKMDNFRQKTISDPVWEKTYAQRLQEKTFPSSLFPNANTSPFPSTSLPDTRSGLADRLNQLIETTRHTNCFKGYILKVQAIHKVQIYKDLIDSLSPLSFSSPNAYNSKKLPFQDQDKIQYIAHDFFNSQNPITLINTFIKNYFNTIQTSVLKGLTEILDPSQFPLPVWKDTLNQYWMFGWHGSKSAHGILHDGLLKSLSGTNAGSRYGDGLYFAIEPCKSLYYTAMKPVNNIPAELMLCAINLGKNPHFDGLSTKYDPNIHTSNIAIPGLVQNDHFEIMTNEQCPIILYMQVLIDQNRIAQPYSSSATNFFSHPR